LRPARISARASSIHANWAVERAPGDVIEVDRAEGGGGGVGLAPLRALEPAIGLLDRIPLRAVEEEKRPPVVERTEDAPICERGWKLGDDDRLELVFPALAAEDFERFPLLRVVVGLVDEDDDPTRVVGLPLPLEERLQARVDLLAVLDGRGPPLDLRWARPSPRAQVRPDAGEGLGVEDTGHPPDDVPLRRADRVEVDRGVGHEREELRGKRRLPLARSSEDPERERPLMQALEDGAEIAGHTKPSPPLPAAPSVAGPRSPPSTCAPPSGPSRRGGRTQSPS
jgi:hypothetical protein